MLRMMVVTTSYTASTAPPRKYISETDLSVLSRRLKALADPTRMRLLTIISAHEGAEACVCDLTEPVGLSQPTVSHHLKVLTRAGLVTREQRGVWAYYAIVPGALESVSTLLEEKVGAPA